MTRYTEHLNIPIPDFREKPYDDTIVNGTFAGFDQAIYDLSLEAPFDIYNTIGTVSAPGELRQNEGVEGGIAVAKGFWNANDGGHGVFSWIVGSAVDDGGTIIVPTGTPSGYWQRLYEGTSLNAKWFGANDGTSDNATYFQTIINAVGSDSATIRIPNDYGKAATVYAIDTAITFPSNIKLQFDTPGAQISPTTGTTVTINSVVDAGPYQIFVGLGDVVFGDGGYGWADWFDEINTATNSGLGTVKLSDKIYAPTETIFIPTSTVLEGTPSRDTLTKGSIIQPTSAVNKGIVFEASHYAEFRRCQVEMSNMSNAVVLGPATTISFTTGAKGGTITDSANGLAVFSAGQTIGISGSTDNLNDSTYIIDTVTAGQLEVKGYTMTTQGAGASITITAGPVGLHLKGCKSAIFENITMFTTTIAHGTVLTLLTPRSHTEFSTYYNKFTGCRFKSGGGQKEGVGVFASALGIGAVTVNTFMACAVQACGIDWLTSTTGSGFNLFNCNGESAGHLGIYTTDTPSAKVTAVKVFGGEWNSADAGEPEALYMMENTINGDVGDNVAHIYHGSLFRGYYRADYYVGKETIVNDLVAGGTIDPFDGTNLRVSSTSGAVTLNTTTPISTGLRGQVLVLSGNSNTDVITIENSGNVELTQDVWYGRLNATLTLYYSVTASKWLEKSRTEPTPLVFRTKKNAFWAVRTEETELTLTGASTSWVSAIPLGADVIGVTALVTDTITGSGVTGCEIGENADANHWGSLSTVIGDKTEMQDFTDRTRYITTAVRDVIVTAIGGTFTGGKVRLSLFYTELSAADS
jgi:hypothetical protein